MMEFGLTNRNTGERTVIFGYNAADAYRRSNLNYEDWTTDYCEFID